MNLAPKYRNAVILESGAILTLISHGGFECWVKTSELYSTPEPKPESKPQPKSKEEAKRARAAGVKRYWRNRKGQNDVSEPRAIDL
jgi:hypothetical protein